MSRLDDYRLEGLDSCLHGESIYEPCDFCGRTEEEIEKHYRDINEEYERNGM